MQLTGNFPCHRGSLTQVRHWVRRFRCQRLPGRAPRQQFWSGIRLVTYAPTFHEATYFHHEIFIRWKQYRGHLKHKSVSPLTYIEAQRMNLIQNYVSAIIFCPFLRCVRHREAGGDETASLLLLDFYMAISSSAR